MRSIIIGFDLWVGSVACLAQIPNTMWMTTIGGGGREHGQAVCETSDGGFVVFGHLDAPSHTGGELILAKLAQSGDTLWVRHGLGAGTRSAFDVIETRDLGFALLATSSLYASGRPIIIKTDSLGVPLWELPYYADVAYKLWEHDDGGFSLAGWICETGSPCCGRLIRTTEEGSVIWDRTFCGASAAIQFYDFVVQPSGVYYLVGDSSWFDGVDTHTELLVATTDSEGYLLWERSIPSPSGPNLLEKIVDAGDGNVVVAGTVRLGPLTSDNRVYYAKLDDTGDILWDSTLAELYSQNIGEIVKTSSGGYLIAATAGDFSDDIYGIRIDDWGNILWLNYWGGLQDEQCHAALQTEDDSYIFVGTTRSFGAGESDIITLKTYSDALLPVELLFYTATPFDGEVRLEWQTASETDNDRFEIERDATIVGRVTADNSVTGSSYSWTEENLINGREYSYTLFSVSISGEQEEIGTVSATPRRDAATIHEYALHQNYPNPFNPKTNIAFDLAEAGEVLLTVYDAQGRTVETLTDGHKAAGRHTVTFDASGLPSGLYFCRMEAGEFRAVRKMVLMR